MNSVSSMCTLDLPKNSIIISLVCWSLSVSLSYRNCSLHIFSLFACSVEVVKSSGPDFSKTTLFSRKKEKSFVWEFWGFYFCLRNCPKIFQLFLFDLSWDPTNAKQKLYVCILPSRVDSGLGITIAPLDSTRQYIGRSILNSYHKFFWFQMIILFF